MRLGEECPYITPCGWCSRLCKPCEEKEKQKARIDAVYRKLKDYEDAEEQGRYIKLPEKIE